MPLIRKPNTAADKTSDTASPDFLALLKSSNADERWTAARSLVDLPSGAEALAKALPSETDSRVREAILTGLSRIGTTQSIDAIVPLLRSDNASVRAGALDALRAMVSKHKEFLPALLKDHDRDVRVLSCELARSLPSHDATQMMCDVLNNEPEANVCAAAIDVLAEVGNTDAIAALTQCAARFSDTPFLAYAIKIATDRIQSQSIARHE